MSMKRSKQRSSGQSRYSGGEDDSPAWAKPAEPDPSWDDIAARPDDAFVPFVLSSRYAKGDLIVHSKFGKGIVLAVEGTRIEVLFQDGKKKLGHAVG
jgi:hypothetical protein